MARVSDDRAAGCGRCGDGGRDHEASDAARVSSFVCDAVAEVAVRYSDGAGAVGASGCVDDDAVFACVGEWDGCAESVGFDLVEAIGGEGFVAGRRDLASPPRTCRDYAPPSAAERESGCMGWVGLGVGSGGGGGGDPLWRALAAVVALPRHGGAVSKIGSVDCRDVVIRPRPAIAA